METLSSANMCLKVQVIGVIISEDGYIVTNNHVVSGATSLKVTTTDGTEYDASIIGTDSQTDLAVIKIEAQNLLAATLGDSDILQVGDPAIAIGNPLGELGEQLLQVLFLQPIDRSQSITKQ